MSSIIQRACQTLLDPAGLSQQELQKIMQKLLGPKIDYADLYFQSSQHESWSLEDSIIKTGNFNYDAGVGARAISGEKTGFSYSDDIELPALLQAADTARCIASLGEEKQVKIATGHGPTKALYTANNPLQSLTQQEKISLLKYIDEKARKADPSIQQVMASLSGVYETILLVNSEGDFTCDIRPLVRLNVSVIAVKDGRNESGYAGCGGRTEYSLFDNATVDGLVNEAVSSALHNLEATAAPAGTMPVVLGPGWPAVLLHEAIGHGLEADFNRKKTSAFSDRIGERVAAKGCTVVDDGTLPNLRGSLTIDDEGVTAKNTVLIEDGILKNYMFDRLNAKLMGAKLTGNGRRESYAHVPMPRMTNTYMLAGKHEHEEIIASVKKGLYAANFAGGQVDITSGKFVFSASEAYLIEDGKITAPVKGATLIGNGPDVLTKVSMIGNNLELDRGVGSCGKDGQTVPVGVGQPSLLVDELIVGGTQA